VGFVVVISVWVFVWPRRWARTRGGIGCGGWWVVVVLVVECGRR
jgi:hypothetical protein